jgi:hypothetical protein
MYNCDACINNKACEIVRKYTVNEPAMAKMARMFELLYGNIQGGYWGNLVSS